MGEPKSALSKRTRTYNETIGQYNRILTRPSELDEAGEYDETARAREGRAIEIMNRYADNIEATRAWKEARERGENPDNVPVPYRTYSKKNNRR